MSEDGEDEGLEVILTSLDSLRESIEGKFGRSNEEIDKRTIAERSRHIMALVSAIDFLSKELMISRIL